MVFICIDVESYEKAHHRVTEIGVAALDTRDLSEIAPGKDGENWRSLIRARHFRIQENGHLVNSEFVSGCPDRFDFGKSEWIRLKDAPAMTAECFKEPFCGPKPTVLPVEWEERNLIFLGHDTIADVRYLQSLGFDPLALPNLLETQDTATMYRVWRRDPQPTSLGRILYDFDIPGFNLHNAGNDAVFTVQAMLGVCVREASIRASPELQALRDEDKAAKVAAAVEEAKQRTADEADGWSDYEADGDGGGPIKRAMKPVEPSSPSTSAAPVTSYSGRGGGGRRGESSRTRGGNNAFNGVRRVTVDDGRGANDMQTSGRSQGGNNRAHHNRGQGRGAGRNRGDNRNGPSRSNTGARETEQQVRYDPIDLC